jgi:outer membrane protein OmpA-like peptidoglycan-associated protein
MKKTLAVAVLAAALPIGAQAQTLQYPGFYIGAIGGVNWLLNNSFTTTVNTPFGSASGSTNANWNTGWAAGGMIGYDFVGPRVELEGIYRDNTGTITLPGVGGGGAGVDMNQVSVMANVLYDFNAGGVIVPYIGAGAGVAFINANLGGGSSSSTQFAYQAMIGVGYNIDPQIRLNLEGRYYGTTSPNFSNSGNVGGVPVTISANPTNNNFSLMASLQFKFGAPVVAPPPPSTPIAQAPSYMVFFDWDRSNLSQQALNTIKQAADQFKATGKARITATGHTDKSGPEDYNMALSLRRANAVKDALVRDGVPPMAISVIGKGETQPLVPTADGVREPQNRRVEIVLQ